ncbi:MAG: hypothetical protein ABEJ74_00760 [Haloferacaceae archaeon]
MSNSNAHPPRIDPIDSLRGGLDRLFAAGRFVGFWLAVFLPVVYLPLLAGGLTTTEAVTFVALIAVNAVSLFVGHGYAR